MLYSTLDEALGIVNRTRVKFGDLPLAELPRGDIGNPRSCPLARALPDDALVSYDKVVFEDPTAAKALGKMLGRAIQNSRYGWVVWINGTPLERFVTNFDAQLYPWLVKQQSFLSRFFGGL